jgi:hypothetical protein
MTIRNKSFSDLITFTRASSATYFDSAGVLRTATSNVPRFDYNPITLAIRGLLVEEQRTNSIRNNTMVGAVAGTPGTLPTNWQIDINTTTGLTKSVVGTGTENGINYVDLRVSGTAAGAGSFDVVFDTSTAIAASNGQTWAPSFYWKLAAGSMTGLSSPTLWLYSYTSAPAFLSSNSISLSTPTSAGLATQRQTGAATLAGGATTAYVRPLVKFTISNGDAIDITLRIGMPQLEQGAFATSVISTTAAAATRIADTASISSLSPWYKSSEGTILAEVQMLAAPLPSAGIPFALTAAGSSHIALRMRPSQKAGASVLDASVTVVDSASAANYTTNISKLSFGYLLNNFASSLNGESPAVDTTGTVPTLTDCNVGSMAGSAYLNGWLRRIVYYPNRLTNAELQAITT